MKLSSTCSTVTRHLSSGSYSCFRFIAPLLLSYPANSSFCLQLWATLDHSSVTGTYWTETDNVCDVWHNSHPKGFSLWKKCCLYFLAVFCSAWMLIHPMFIRSTEYTKKEHQRLFPSQLFTTGSIKAGRVAVLFLRKVQFNVLILQLL